MAINYQVNSPVTADEFVALLRASTLGDRRPIEDVDCMTGMVKNSNLMVTAWDSGMLVGIARSMTDFHYACYLSDLAVHAAYQKQGIGRRLLTITQDNLGPKCRLILVAAPMADAYYAQLGLQNNPRCWVLDRDQKLHG